MAQPVLTVPLADPGAAYRAQKEAIDAAVMRVLGSGRFLMDEEVNAFESEFAKWLGSPHVVACGSGTDALVLVLRGLSVGLGCTVATVSHTAVATVAAVEMAGAIPLLLDVEPDHYTMAADELAAVLQHPPSALPPIKAVIVVHLYGQAADISSIAAICTKHGVALLEDCSHAHGARFQGRRLGTFGDGAAFSFYPTKNIGAIGDAGAVASSNLELASRVAALRQYGWRDRRVSNEPGINSRMDEIHAAVLRIKLHSLEAANQRRQVIASAYDQALARTTIHAPARRRGGDHVFHQYVVRTQERAKLQAHLHARGIATAVHYQIPVHRQAAYADRVALGPAKCRATDRLANQILSLPIFPEMTDAQVEYVADALWTI